MQAEVRLIEANRLREWPNWLPSGIADEYQKFTISIGPVGDLGADYFEVLVATPQGKRENNHRGKFIGLVVKEFVPDLVEKAICDFVSESQASTWLEIVDLLRTCMFWEYEGYPGIPERPT